MSLYHRNLSEINIKDIKNLKEQGVVETITLDYKQDITHTLKNDETKINILKDIVAFANSQGGDIIIGVSENSGVPKKLTGIDISKVDELKRMIEPIMANSIYPRISKYEFSNPILLDNDNNKCILILRIYRSFNIPHYLTYKMENRFWFRTESGNQLMDFQQIKSAFDYSQNVQDKIKHFIHERISVIESDEIPLTLKDIPKTVIHFIPLSHFMDNDQILNLKTIENNNKTFTFGIDDGPGSCNKNYNLDGLVKGSHLNENTFFSYVQYFKNGCIESVDCHFLSSKRKNIPVYFYEKELSQVIPNFIQLLKDNRITPPIIISIHLLNVKNFEVVLGKNDNMSNKLFGIENQRIKKENIHFPEVFIDSYEENIGLKLMPIFHSFWNLAGYEKSNNFDENGKFIRV